MRRLCSLAAPVKADPTAALFDKAEAAAEADHDKVYDCVFHHGFSICYAACVFLAVFSLRMTD
jgi:hypothetical protein